MALLERRRERAFHPNIAPPAAFKQWRRRGRVSCDSRWQAAHCLTTAGNDYLKEAGRARRSSSSATFERITIRLTPDGIAV